MPDKQFIQFTPYATGAGDDTILLIADPITSKISGITRANLFASVTKASIGLGNVDNTSDINKPLSTASTTALALKAPINNPTFTGTVNLPAATVIGAISPAELLNLDGSTSNIQTQLNGKVSLSQALDIEITDFTRGIILRSLDGVRWRITVGIDGAISTTVVIPEV